MNDIQIEGTTTISTKQYLDFLEMQKMMHEKSKSGAVIIYVRYDYGLSSRVAFDYKYYTESERINELEYELQHARQIIANKDKKEEEVKISVIEKEVYKPLRLFGLLIATAVLFFLIGTGVHLFQ
jgi:hypothetical protein